MSRDYGPPPPGISQAFWDRHCAAIDYYHDRMGECVIPEEAYRPERPYPREWEWDDAQEEME